MADFLTTTSAMPVYMIYPRFLMDMDLSETEKLVYVVLLDRARLSMSNGNWEDESGHVFLIYPIKALAEALHRSEMTVKRALGVLEERGLIHRKRMGLNQANRIFVRLPIQNVSASGDNKNALSGGNADDPPEGTDLLPLTERKGRSFRIVFTDEGKAALLVREQFGGLVAFDRVDCMLGIMHRETCEDIHHAVLP